MAAFVHCLFVLFVCLLAGLRCMYRLLDHALIAWLRVELSCLFVCLFVCLCVCFVLFCFVLFCFVVLLVGCCLLPFEMYSNLFCSS